MATFTERLELLIEATSKGAVGELQKTSAATEELTGLQKVQGTVSSVASKYLGQYGITAEQTGTALKAAAVGAGALVAVKVGEFALDSAKAFSSVTSEVRAFQRVAGTSAEDSSRLVFAVKEMGIAPDAAALAFGRLATRIGTGKDTLDQFGISTTDAHGNAKDLGTVVAEVSDAYQNAGSASEKAAIGNAAFGKSWQTLAPLLGKGKQDLQDIFAFADTTHQVFSQDDLERGRQFTVATSQLHAAMEGLKIEIGSAVAPAITSATKTLTGFITGADKAAGSVGGLGKVISVGFDLSPISNVASAVASASDLMQGHFADAGKEFVQSIPVIGNVASVVDDLTGALGFGGGATETYSAKQKDLQGALQKVADLHTQGKQGTAEYAKAVNDAQTASDQYSRTNTQVAASLQSVAEKEAAATDQHIAMANAGLNVQASMLTVKSSLDAEAQAQTDANNAAQFGVDQSANVQAAHVKTQQAILAVVSAAQARAVQALGPGAASEDVAKAKVDATESSLAFLAATTPTATQAIKDLGYQIVVLPGGKTVVVTADVSDAIAELNRLKQYIGTVPGVGTAIGVAVIPGTRSAPAGASPAALRMPGASGLAATPELLAGPSAAPRAAYAAAAVANVTINVSVGGLGADAPEIQRAVVAALRGYVDRNGPVRDVVGL